MSELDGFRDLFEFENVKNFGTKSVESPENNEEFWHKNMSTKKYTYDYANINIRAKVAQRFRKFSKKVARTHAATLTVMMDFFEWHNYTPHQRFAKDLGTGQELNRKRIDAVIAIIKSVEKSQNIPLTNIETMLKALFQEENKTYDAKALKIEIPEEDNLKKTKKEKTTVSRIKYDRTNRKLEEIKERLQYVLDQIEPISNRFGKDFLKVEITREELARFKQTLKDS